MPTTYLSQHFTLEELTKTSQPFYNEPSPRQVDALTYGAARVLQPWRDRIGVLEVTSGYRSFKVNQAVGGAPTSQHLDGQAADVVPRRATKDEAWRVLLQLMEDGAPIDQAILYESKPHIHVSWKPNGTPRKQLLVATRDGQYVAWSTYRRAG
ncbi:MAG: D-Ala-D-Ala carboxypeptidase family metallohydrolase [Myxococcota bacterium]